MPVVENFRELNVYKLGRAIAQNIFSATQGFPQEERYSLTDQIRRSSRATKAMIAEAWDRRRYKAVFVNKVDEALGEINETRAWLDDALDCHYITPEQFQKLDSDCRSVAAMLARMIDRASDFCKNAPATDYRVAENDSWEP